MSTINCHCGALFTRDTSRAVLHQLSGTGYCPDCRRFIGVYEAEDLLVEHDRQAEWETWCAEIATREDARNRENYNLAYAANPNATSRDVMAIQRARTE